MLAVLLLLVAPVILGVLIGYARNGRLRFLVSIQWGPLWLLWLAALIQAAQYYMPSLRHFFEVQIGLPMLVLIYLCVFIWLVLGATKWVGLMKWAAIIILLGGILNGVVISLNGRMPYDSSVAIQLGLDPADSGPKNAPQDSETLLSGLGDVFPVPLVRKIVSPGDVLIAIGSAALVAGAMTGKESRKPVQVLGRATGGKAAWLAGRRKEVEVPEINNH